MAVKIICWNKKKDLYTRNSVVILFEILLQNQLCNFSLSWIPFFLFIWGLSKNYVDRTLTLCVQIKKRKNRSCFSYVQSLHGSYVWHFIKGSRSWFNGILLTSHILSAFHEHSNTRGFFFYIRSPINVFKCFVREHLLLLIISSKWTCFFSPHVLV